MTTPLPNTPLYRILDKARWAASGDNTQPWRFRPMGALSLQVIYSTASPNIYEYRDGEPLHVSVGMLLETMRIAAAHEGFACQWEYVSIGPGQHGVTVQFSEDVQCTDELLYAVIERRSVNRRPYRKDPLTSVHRKALDAALGNNITIEWHESVSGKKRMAAFNARATDVRLRAPEAYPVHREVLEWDNAFSDTKIPIKTLPMNPFSMAIMRWALKKWSRVAFLNRWLAGTVPVRIENDIIPGKRCAAHFILVSTTPLDTIVALYKAGAAVQRFWLTAAALGIAMQPGLPGLIFSDYHRKSIVFSDDKTAVAGAATLAKMLSAIRSGYAQPDAQAFFAGRVGYPLPSPIVSRSLRKPLQDLWLDDPGAIN